MANKNQVTLTFAGDTDKLESSFAKVEGGAGKLATSFDRSAKAADEHGNAVGKLGEKVDGSERSLLGVHDVIDGTATIMQGPGKQGIVAYIQGWADLAGGLAPLLLQMAEMNAKLVITKVAQVAGAIATGAATIAQWAWNAALIVGAAAMTVLTSPITLVVLGIAALVAIIILVVKYHKQLGDAAVAAWHGIQAAAEATWNWLKQIPGWVEGAFKSVASAISQPFRAAFNFVSDAWNNTIGKLSWSVPSWVPFIGGNTISVPHLPKFHSGGTVPNVPGGEMLAVLQSGERVTPRSGGSGGGGPTVRFAGNTDSAFATAFQNLVRGGMIVIEP